MASHRFFAEGTLPTTSDPAVLPLSEADLHHLRDVARLGAGEEIVVVAEGTAHRVLLTGVGETAEGRVLEVLPARMLARLTLVQGLAKGEKMDDVVRQATELGVSRIIPFAAERSVVRLDGAKAAARVERWRRIAGEAAKQAQRIDLPSVRSIAKLEDLAGMLASSVVLVAWEDAEAAPGIGDAIDSRLDPDTDVAVVVGPEGGLTPFEVTTLASAGATVVSLGGTVLRTETAGVVATALALYARGGLGASRG
jgi:16S rRNA (uracil1498-N3)-methyltransferase